MAVYHFNAKVIQRSQGRSAIAAAAYRSASALHDETAGRTYNYLAKPGVIHSEILLPAGAPERWQDRAVLWNEVERIERRCDAVVAREIELSLPRELSQADAIRLVQDFAHAHFVSRGMVADLNVHWGQTADGSAQPHAHIMLSMRQVVAGPAGHPEEGAFGLKERNWNDRELLRSWRGAWAELVNARLAEAGIDLRVDHRSNAARGIDLEPQNKIGPAGARRAVRGEDAERADEHRAIAQRNGERLLAEPELALQALTQQQSTFTRQDLAQLVHRHSDGAAQFAEVMAKVEASPELVRVGEDGRGRSRFSTREMVAIERRMEAASLDLSRRTTHTVTVERRKALLSGTHLGDEQQLAFGHVTRSRDLAVVVGYAGTGKSTMLGVARQAWEAEGYTVRGAALSGIAAEGLEGGSGITSRTIASWEHAWAQGHETLERRDVLVVDEAGMIGSRQMDRVIAAVRNAGAKLVLVGDHEQLQAIEAGAAFRAIAERVGAVELTEVRRQQTAWQRAATRELATGQTGAALDRYTRAGMVHAHPTDAAAEAAVVSAWQEARKQAPEDSRIILTHTRDDVRRLNDHARQVRRAADELGDEQLLPTERGTRAFAVDDRIYFLRNERGLGVKNGTLGTITNIAGEGAAARLTVRLDRADAKTGGAAVVSFALSDYSDIDHGYAATAHKAQSVTVDWAHVLATPGMDRHLAYVALSRHRHGLSLHWSKESFASPTGLTARLARERAKDTTLDYGESEAELCAAYAERRGLHPLAPKSEIVFGGTLAATQAPAASLPDTHARASENPGLSRRNLQRSQLERVVHPLVGALQRAVEQQEAMATALAAAVERLRQRLSRQPVVTALPPPAPDAASAPLRRDPFKGQRLKAPPPAAGISVTPQKPAVASEPTASDARARKQAQASQRRAERKAAAILARLVSPAEPLPWAGLDPTPPAAPLWPAEWYEPRSSLLVHAAVQGTVRRAREQLEGRYAEVYREPQEASFRFFMLMGELGTEAAKERVARDPSILGSLRGGWLTAAGRTERAQALHSGPRIVAYDQNLRQAEAEAWQQEKAADERRRQQANTEVPALSAKAEAALRALAETGVKPGWTSPTLSKDRNPTPEDMLAMAKGARLYEAILGDSPLLAELNRFEAAATSRLASSDDRVGSPRPHQMSEARQAPWCKGVLVAARALHSWYPVLKDHIAAHPRLKLQVDHAEFMSRLNARRCRQRPGRGAEFKPSSGPSFGPGMG